MGNPGMGSGIIERAGQIGWLSLGGWTGLRRGERLGLASSLTVPLAECSSCLAHGQPRPLNSKCLGHFFSGLGSCWFVEHRREVKASPAKLLKQYFERSAEWRGTLLGLCRLFILPHTPQTGTPLHQPKGPLCRQPLGLELPCPCLCSGAMWRPVAHWTQKVGESNRCSEGCSPQKQERGGRGEGQSLLLPGPPSSPLLWL